MVHAVVVHYRGERATRACLAALERAEGSPAAFLVDTSERGEGVGLAREFPRVRAIEAGANLGFAGGSNLGIRRALAAGATHALLVNSDAEVAPDFLAPMLTAAARPAVGIVTGKILLPEANGAPRRIWAAGGRFARWRALGLNRGEGQPDGPEHDRACDVDFASGCLLLARRSVFETVGLLDERYFLYLEDVEFCERARRVGFRIRYEPRARAVHAVHAASGGDPGREPPALVYYLTRNRLLYARERLEGLERAGFYAFFLLSRLAKVAAEAARGRRATARLILRAVADGLRGREGRATPGGLW